jgi:hypothetical protein
MSDRRFWSLTKEISGLSQQRSASCPSVDALADHFATKMSNGQGLSAGAGDVSVHPPVVMKGWKVRFKRVFKALQALDPSKSVNGVGNRFLKACSKVFAPVVTKLFRFVVRRANSLSTGSVAE